MFIAHLVPGTKEPYVKSIASYCCVHDIFIFFGLNTTTIHYSTHIRQCVRDSPKELNNDPRRGRDPTIFRCTLIAIGNKDVG